MHFQVVIPTIPGREQYLAYSLKSCLAQNDGDFSVLVSSNGRSAAVRAVVEQIADRRLRLLEPDRYYPMSMHWEYALGKSDGDVLMVIGDDDALLPGAIALAREVFDAHPRDDILVHTPMQYYWPDFPTDYLRSRYSAVPAPSGQVTTHDTKPVLQQVMEHRAWYGQLPVLYHGFVRRRLLDTIRASTDGLFRRACPDIYSDILLAIYAERFLRYDGALTIGGQGARSNGVQVATDKAMAQDFFVNLPAEMRSRYSGRSVALELVEYCDQLGARWQPARALKPAHLRLFRQVLREAFTLPTHRAMLLDDLRQVAKDRFPAPLALVCRVCIAVLGGKLPGRYLTNYLARRDRRTLLGLYRSAAEDFGVQDVYALAQHVGERRWRHA